jgi:hypothetical protein
MSEIILVITATCRTVGCEQNGVAHVFEQESGIDFVVHCGQCNNPIEDVSSAPKA